ncbi:MAG: fructose-6-phosphate aldolase [Planctomycetes bacterium]|nr:fructose-6-phosphate aldolase [Planctomycetota bacterium]
MKIFLDTANLDEIRKAIGYGFIDGVTTNPSLVKKEGISYERRIKEICEIVEGPISAECITEGTDDLIQESRVISKWARNVVVKIPMTWSGLKATKVLSVDGIKVNMTLCFSVTQALFAAKAGAFFISPFIGRIDDMGENGLKVLSDIVQTYKNYSFKTQVLTASVRHVGHVIDACTIGADIVTLPFSVYEKLISHPLTDKGLEIFRNDSLKIPKK